MRRARRLAALALTLSALALLAAGRTSAAPPVDRPTDAQWAQVLAASGRWVDLQVALEVMFAESGGNPAALNPSGAEGAWQFMANTLADHNCRIDPICSTAAAYRVSSGGGNWSKWEAYTSGAYTRQAARAAAAMAAAGQTPSPQLPVLPAAPQPRPGPAADSNKGMGIDGMVPPPPLQHGNQAFLYERFAPLDYPPLHMDAIALAQSTIGAILGFTDPTQLGMNVSMNTAANLLTSLLVLIGVVATRLLGWSLRVDLMAAADGPLNSVVGGLAQGFYQPLLPLLLTLMLGWLIYTWLLRRRAVRGFVGVGWMFGAMTLAAIYFAAPSAVLDQASAFTSGISRSVLSAVGGADTTVHRGDPTIAQGPVDDAELRLFADRFWNVYIYQPWTIAEFGRLDPKDSSGQPLGIMLLDAHAGHPNHFEDALRAQPQEVQDWYNGAKGGDRVIVVAIAVLVAGVACVAFLWAAVNRLASSLVFLALLMALPFILLLALHPSVGRKILMRWLEMAAGSLWRQVIYNLFLAVMVVVVGVAAAAAAVGGWGLVALCQLAATAGIVIFRKPLMAVFGQLSGSGLRIEHVGTSKTAEKAHQKLEETRQRVPIPAFARSRTGGGARQVAGKAGKKAAANGAGKAVSGGAGKALGAATGGWTTLAAAIAIKGGQVALRRGEDVKRGLQSGAGAFLVDGKAGKPSPARMPERSLGVSPGAVSSHSWQKIRRRGPQFAAQQQLPAAAAPPPKQKKAVKNATPKLPKPKASPPAAAKPTWVRQPGGGQLLRK